MFDEAQHDRRESEPDCVTGYTPATFVLQGDEVPAYVWVKLCDGALDDWGDAVNALTGERIPWETISAAFTASGSSFEAETAPEILQQAERFGLWASPPVDPRATLPRPLRKAEARREIQTASNYRVRSSS